MNMDIQKNGKWKNDGTEKSYAENLRAALTVLPVKKKCCAYSLKDADALRDMPADARPDAMRSAAARCKCAACLPHFVTGLFLLYGSVTDPAKRNHLEFSFETEAECEALEEILQPIGIAGGRTRRKKQAIYYLKDGEAIADFLAYIGANTAAFDFMNSRIEREFRNNANRLVNCDTANIDKSLKAAEEQTAAIRALTESGKISLLPASLRQTAELRMQFSQLSMKELGDAHEPPISKSGVSHRLTKILDFARSVGVI